MVSISRAGLLARGIAAATACAASGTAALASVEFVASDYARYRRSGRESISGVLNVGMPGGGTEAKEGAHVIALPNAPYVAAWLQRSAAEIAARPHGPDEFADPDLPSILVPFHRVAITGADGTFVFNGLPAGEYVLRGSLSVPFARTVNVLQPATAIDASGHTITGGEVATPITVNDYSFVWMDSTPISVSGGHTSSFTFRIVARRDKIDHRH